MTDLHELVSRLKELARDIGKTPSRAEFCLSGVSDYSIRMAGGYNKILEAADLTSRKFDKAVTPAPRVLIFDIETAPLLAYVWKLWDENIGLNQLLSGTYLLSWAAKWLGEPEVFYADQRNAPDIEDDSEILKGLWELLDQADIVITHNGDRFDIKKVNSRFIKHGIKPPSSFRSIDTLKVAKRYFGFDSNKLEFLAKYLACTPKSGHQRFAGFELWKQCVFHRNPEAFIEMEDYNRQDVLTLEEVYLKLRPYMRNHPNFNVFTDSLEARCFCGGEYEEKEYAFTNTAKHVRSICKVCGAEAKDRQNILSKDKKETLLRS